MNYLHATCIVLKWILFWNLILGQNEQLRSELRFTKVTNCNKTGLKWYLQNMTVYSQYPRTYLNGAFYVTSEIKSLKYMKVRFERCIDEGFNCEDFQNWNIPNFCPMLNWKNQMWSGFLDFIYPPFHCPIKKMVYKIRNASIDVDAVLRWYPESVKYKWRATNEYVDERNAVVFCGIFEGYVYQYVKRNRNKTQ